MDRATRAQFVKPVEKVLRSAKTGKGMERHFLSSYQILALLPAAPRNALIALCGGVNGSGAGKADTAPRVIADIIKHDIKGVQTEYMDSRRTAYKIGTDVFPGYGVIGLYRIR